MRRQSSRPEGTDYATGETGTKKGFPEKAETEHGQEGREIGHLESHTWQWIEPDPPGFNTTVHLCPWAHLEIKLPQARIHATPETRRWVHFGSTSPEAGCGSHRHTATYHLLCLLSASLVNIPKLLTPFLEGHGGVEI